MRLRCGCFFFQAEDGIRDKLVTGVQTCALPISLILVTGLSPGRTGAGHCETVPQVLRDLWRRDRQRTGELVQRRGRYLSGRPARAQRAEFRAVRRKTGATPG